MTARIRPTVCGRVLARSSTPEGADRIHLGIPLRRLLTCLQCVLGRTAAVPIYG